MKFSTDKSTWTIFPGGEFIENMNKFMKRENMKKGQVFYYIPAREGQQIIKFIADGKR